MINEVLIIAGATRNSIDSMRVITATHWSDGSSGRQLLRTGYRSTFRIAISLSRLTVQTKPRNIHPRMITREDATLDTKTSMLNRCSLCCSRRFTVKNVESTKIPSGNPVTLTLHPTPKYWIRSSLDEQVILASLKPHPVNQP